MGKTAMRLKRFLRNSSGNMAIMFSLAAVPLLLAAGVASDLLRANNANTLLQAATDAAALAGAAGKKNAMTEVQLKKIVDDYLLINRANKILKSVTVQKSAYDKKTGIFSVKLTGKIETTFVALAGYSTMDVIGYSEVELGSGALEIAMVLDTTGSMNAEGRLDALKAAATELVDKLLKNKSSDSYIKVGMVPFADYVNVGVSNRNKFWLNVAADTKKYECWDSYPNVTYSNCHMETVNGYNDGVPITYQQNVCDTNPGAVVKQCGMVDHKWNGVVGSRNNGLDTKIVGSGAKYPGIIDAWGPQGITEMTDSRSTLNSNISSLTANSETYIPTGLLWGWELLNSAEAFGGVKTKAEMLTAKGTKALILMTDGDNTRSADYPYHWGNDAAVADQKTKELCEGVKQDGISVYTVAFKVGKASSKQMLVDCASTPGQAFDAQNNAALLAAFGDIAGQLTQLRLTK